MKKHIIHFTDLIKAEYFELTSEEEIKKHEDFHATVSKRNHNRKLWNIVSDKRINKLLGCL